MSSSIFRDYFGRGLDADLPDPTGFVIPADTAALYYATDTGKFYLLNAAGTAWDPFVTTPPYRFTFFFTSTPITNEVLFLHTAVAGFTLEDDFAGAVADVGTNPAASFVMTVKLNGSSVGTITVSTGGSITFSTTGGTVSVSTGDLISISGPSTADTTIANFCATFTGS